MKELQTKKRNGVIDTFRFLYALVIMAGHSVTVGVKSPFPFEPVGILVEFFLFLSGFLACESFSKNSTVNNLEYFDVAIKSTIKKFRPFVPYLVISVCLSYSLIYKDIFKGGAFVRLFYEMFLLNYAFDIGIRVAPLFYLAAMVVVFPIFAILCQLKNNTFKLIIAMYSFILYYHDLNDAVTATYPYVLLRVFCGMCGGILIWNLVNHFNANKQCIKFYALVGLLLCSSPLVLSGLQKLDRRLALICEFIGILFVFLDASNLKSKNNTITDFFAKMSMAIYILHWSIGENISHRFPKLTIKYKIFLYYIITIGIAVIIILLIDCWNNRKKSIKFSAVS